MKLCILYLPLFHCWCTIMTSVLFTGTICSVFRPCDGNFRQTFPSVDGHVFCVNEPCSLLVVSNILPFYHYLCFRRKSFQHTSTESPAGDVRYCLYYNRFGRCSRGDCCPFIHDPDKISICTR